MNDLILAIDQGTTGTTALIVDAQGRTLGRTNVEFPQIFPEPGWVEHDPEQIWDSVRLAVIGAMHQAGCSGGDLSGVGITNQRETTLLWERDSGRPIHNAIVWQCRRTASVCQEIAERADLLAVVRERTGLVLDAYFSGTKIAWILDHVPSARARADAGALAFGTVDSFLVWRLTSGKSHVTDASNASRTLLMSLADCRWDDAMLELFRVPRAVLPTIVPNAGIVGRCFGLDFLPDGLPVCGMAGDQQAALFGQACFAPGEVKCTYGTGAFVLMNVGELPVRSAHRLLSTVAWKLGDKTTYALEGSAFVAGAAVQWLRDGLGLIERASDIEALAMQVPSSDGVHFVPALSGLGAPHWDPDARGILSGLTRGTTRGHVARAVLEGIALEVVDLLTCMRSDSGLAIPRLRVDGGASQNNLLMQTQADLASVKLDRPADIESTGRGAAYLARLGLAKDADHGATLDRFGHALPLDRTFVPSISDADRAHALRSWELAVRRARLSA